MREQGTRTDRPMKPQVVVHELNALLSDEAIVATDSGTITSWAARHIDIRGRMMFSVSGTLASMACGVPYALAAAVAYPGRQVVAIVGDGGFTMLLGELATAVKYGLDIKVIVISNHSLGQIKWEQMVFLGNPEYGCDLKPVDFAAVAQGFGVRGFTIEEPARCADTLRQALETRGPVVVNAIVDPHEPPMPPRVNLEQATKLATSLARGTPDALKIALTIVSDKVRQLI
jgi:pyruvate dehydrogenase (quinone)/pyruvate oxidase